jgi:hypothetical protein
MSILLLEMRAAASSWLSDFCCQDGSTRIFIPAFFSTVVNDRMRNGVRLRQHTYNACIEYTTKIQRIPDAGAPFELSTGCGHASHLE